MSSVHCQGQEASGTSRGIGPKRHGSPEADGGEVGKRVAGSGGFARRGVSTATDPPRPECPKSGDGGETHGGNHQIEGSLKEGPNYGWHRYRARCRRTERIRSHVDVDRRSRFHFDGSRERCPVIRSLYGWRGVRIGEASNPGPQSNARRVPGASQSSGGSTQAADSHDVRAVLRGARH